MRSNLKMPIDVTMEIEEILAASGTPEIESFTLNDDAVVSDETHCALGKPDEIRAIACAATSVDDLWSRYQTAGHLWN